MVYTPDYGVLQEAFTYTWVFGTRWIIPLILTFLAMAFITRDLEKWKILFFPVNVLFTIMGLNTHPAILIGGFIMFVIEALSTQMIGNIIDAIRRKEEKKKVKQIKNLARVTKLEKLKRVLGKYQSEVKTQ